jgi:integrase
MTTIQGCERHVAEHLVGPAVAPFELSLLYLTALSGDAIRDHYGILAEGYPTEKHSGSGRTLLHRAGLSSASIRRVHASLHRALNVAVEMRLIDFNPATGGGRRLPEGAPSKKRRLECWQPAGLRWFLEFCDAIDDCRSAYYPLWFLLSHTGIRRGEAAGLRWEDFDADRGLPHVRRNRVPLKSGTVSETTPKTRGSVRILELDDETVQVLDRPLRRSQARDRLAAGPKWQNSGYIFTDRLGQPMLPNVISWEFRFTRELANRSTKQAGDESDKLPSLSVHGLRHTFATIALQGGVPVTVVSKYLGHESIAMTLNVYAHATRGAQREVADTAAKVIRKGSI